MRRVAVVGAVVIAGCAGVRGDPRSYLEGRGAYDLQCPEEEYVVTPQLPQAWRAIRVDPDDPSKPSVGQIVYATPDGKQTWCQYSARVWSQQVADIAKHKEPSLDLFDNPERRRLIERVREQQNEAERESRKQSIAAERARIDEENARVRAEKNDRDGREDAIRTTAAGLVAEKESRAFASIRRCMIEAEIDEKKSEMSRERRVGRESGYEDKRWMHKLGDDLVSLQDELKDINTIMRESKMGSPMPCGKAALSAVIACHADRDECTSRELAVAARGFDLAMSFLGTDGDRSSESVLEAARTFLDEAGIAEASGLSQAVSAMLAR